MNSRKQVSTSPLRSRTRSTTRSPSKRRTRSPSRSRTRSLSKRRTRSTTRSRTRSPSKRRTRSPSRRTTRSRTRSPSKRRTRSTTRSRTRSPSRRTTRIPSKRRTRSTTRSPSRSRTRSQTKGSSKRRVRRQTKGSLKTSNTSRKIQRGGQAASTPNPLLKNLYLLLKKVPFIKIPVVPEFEEKTNKQSNQQGGYPKNFSLKRNKKGNRTFMLKGFTYDKDIQKDKPVDTQITYGIEDDYGFGEFNNIKPKDAAKKIYSRLCKNIRSQYNTPCVNMLLYITEKCCDNNKKNNTTRDYYYYVENNPLQKTVTTNKGRVIQVFNNSKVIPIFAIRNKSNTIDRLQSINEAVSNANQKRNVSLAVYSKRRSAGKKMLKNSK